MPGNSVALVTGAARGIGRAMTRALAAAGAKVATLQGGEIRTRKDDKGNVRVQGARVVRADIETSNGVIHVIDTVLIPN